VSATAFEALDCECFGDAGEAPCYLRADYSLRCDDGKGGDSSGYAGLLDAAIPVIVVWPVGVFGLYFLAIAWERRGGDLPPRASAFLLDYYTEGCYYWELVELAKKLLLVALLGLPFLVPESLAQLICALSSVIFFLAWHVYAQPYKLRGDNLFALVCNTALVLVFLVGVVLKQDELIVILEDSVPSSLLARYQVSRLGACTSTDSPSHATRV
jgi:hypothetical protein